MSEVPVAGAAKSAPAPHLFGPCSAEARNHDSAAEAASAWHGRCPGAISTPKGLVLCSCPTHKDDRRCHVCKTEVEPSEEYVEARRQHANLEACEIAENLRLADSRAAHNAAMSAVRADAERTRAADRVRRGEVSGSTEPKPPRVKKAPPAPQHCHCGCGGMTKGGRFVPGHDARLKSHLRSLFSYANYAELIARGWAKAGELDQRQQEEGQKLIDEAGGAEQYITGVVAHRYRNTNN